MAPRAIPADIRFWAKVNKDGPVPTHRPELGPCWVWTAGKTSDGYGVFYPSGSARYSHKWFWEQENGPVPDGLELDHLCRNRACVRPSHLEAVTHAVNCQRQLWRRWNAAKTNCPHGHPYDEVNTYSYRGRRYCKTCNGHRVAA